MQQLQYLYVILEYTNTYDHRLLRTRLPVRSALFKQQIGGLVLESVTIGESPLSYVFDFDDF